MKYTIKQLIERLDTEIETVCCESAVRDWQTLRAAVLAQQAHNKQSTPCSTCVRVTECSEFPRCNYYIKRSI